MQQDQELAKAESECSDSIVTSATQMSSSELGKAGPNKSGSCEPQHQTVPGVGVSELQLADSKQLEEVTPRRSMKWLENEILTLRENTPKDGLQKEVTTSTYASSNRELDFLGLLSELQVVLADIERRLEKLEIKDMEGQITGWAPGQQDVQFWKRQLRPTCYQQALSLQDQLRQLALDRESTVATMQSASVDAQAGVISTVPISPVPRLLAACNHSMALDDCASGDGSAKQDLGSSCPLVPVLG